MADKVNPETIPEPLEGNTELGESMGGKPLPDTPYREPWVIDGEKVEPVQDGALSPPE